MISVRKSSKKGAPTRELIIVAFVVGLVCLCIPSGDSFSKEKSKSESGSKNWPSLVLAEGQYKVQFPGKPKKVESISNTSLGPIDAVSYSMSLTKLNVILNVAYFDMPAEQLKTEKPMDVIRSTMKIILKDIRVQADKEKTLLIDQNPGLQVEAKELVGMKVTVRLILVGKRMYQLMVVSYAVPVPWLNKKFFESFTLAKQEGK